jgi:hypothetical protein
MKSRLCAFADWFPGFIGAQLEEAHSLRHQAREVGLTDHMLLELKKLRDHRIVVENSNEITTGADMDWFFVRADRGRSLHLTVQAKVLHYTRPRVPLRYDELAYPARSGRQAGRLTNFARRQSKAGLATYPLYLFYNPANANAWRGRLNCPSGVSLANGHRVRNHLVHARRASRFAGAEDRVPWSAIELTAVRQMMFCLHPVFCSPSEAIPEPDEVASRLASVDRQMADRNEWSFRPPLPAAGDQVPKHVHRLIDLALSGRTIDDVADGDPQGLSRPRVTFISGAEFPHD